MQKRTNLNKQTQKSATEEQRQTLDLHLTRQLLLTSEVQKEVDRCEQELNYCHQFLQNIKEQHQKAKDHHLLARGHLHRGWQSTIKQLTSSAISPNFTLSDKQNKSDFHRSSKAIQCSQKDHLGEVLGGKEVNLVEEQSQILQNKLDSLYKIIGELVSQEYMSEKMTKRIKKQARRAAKIKVRECLEKEVDKQKGWLQQRGQEVKGENCLREIQQLGMHNLQLMKLLMNKKVNINDLLYSQLAEMEEEITRTDQTNKLEEQILGKYKQAKNVLKQRMSHPQANSQNELNARSITSAQRGVSLAPVLQFLTEVEDVLNRLDEYEGVELERQSQQLSMKLDSMLAGK